MTLHYITNLNKRLPQFILSIDAGYYNHEHVIAGNHQLSAFSQAINAFPHQFFCRNAQSYLAIREREYLDEALSFQMTQDLTANYTKNTKGEDKKGDPRYKQLLPYMIARQKQEDGTYLYFPYRRTKKVGESRLAGNGSLGYGGHIDLEDIVSTGSVIDLKATILKSALREAIEEFTLSHTVFGEEKATAGLYADAISFGDLFIVDNSNDVGELHLGIIMYFDVPADWTLEASEDELAKLPPMTADEMLLDPDFNGENWTMLYLKHLAENTGGDDADGDDEFVTDEHGLELELVDCESEDDIPGTEDKPLYKYSTSDIEDIMVDEIKLISVEEFAELDAEQLLAFKDESILAMSHEQVKFYREALLTRMNDIAFDQKKPQSPQVEQLTKRAEQLEQTASVLAIDHGGVKVGEVDQSFFTNVAVPEFGEQTASTSIVNAAPKSCELGINDRADNLIPVTPEEEDHFRFMNDGVAKRDE